MPSQFFGLNIAYTGLLASNAALNTTNNNIANVQTEGYSRQQVTQQAANAIRVFQTYGCAGAGVETLAIERIRNEFYDSRYWVNNSKVGEYGQKQYYMEQVESFFDDNGQNAGFKTVFDQLMVTGLQALMDNPDALSNKEQFIGYAGALAEYFNGAVGNLQKLQKDVNQEIKVKIDEINSLADEIATLNKQINTIELNGSMKANELRDRRTLLLDQLSEIVDVETKETKVLDVNNEDRETGGTRFIVRIAGGQTLVDGDRHNELECVARTTNEKVNQTDIDGLYDVQWKNGSSFHLDNASMGGALRGLVEMRDGNNSEYFTGTVKEIGMTEDGKHDTVTVEVGRHYLIDLNKCNLSDSGGVISLGNREYYYDSWTYNVSYDDKGKAVYSYTFTLSSTKQYEGLNDRRLTNDRVGKEATIGTGISYQGVPYYMMQINEWVRTFSQKFNDILRSGYSDDIPGIDLFTADMATEDKQYVFEDYSGESVEDYLKRVEELMAVKGLTEKEARLEAITDYRYDKETKEAYNKRVEKLQATNDKLNGAFSKDEAEKAAQLTVSVGKNVTGNDNYYLMTGKNVSISSTLENDPDRLANKREESDGVEQNDLLRDLKDLATNKGKMSFRGCSAGEFLQCVLADIALNTKRAETFYKSYQDIAYSIDTQRISISGVDEDEEAVNLVRYQNGYNLASKMIQTLTEIYDRLILQTGV
ncbi:MAG TPA: flagellar hook-associated protein FlgK [Lachnospiraceae bacterium]|nr:flagellar hook-associated protein FlgK [Lachnospiraceae bacterium]